MLSEGTPPLDASPTLFGASGLSLLSGLLVEDEEFPDMERAGASGIISDGLKLFRGSLVMTGLVSLTVGIDDSYSSS